MDIYKDLMVALSERTEEQRRLAYDELKGRRISYLSISIYLFYVTFGAFVGFLISNGTHALTVIGVLGSVAFFVSIAMFKEYISTKKKLENVIALLLIAEDERKHALIDAMPSARSKSHEKA